MNVTNKAKNGDYGGTKKMKPEEGVTRNSLQNAKELIKRYGTPDVVEIYQIKDEHLVKATWHARGKLPHGTTHEFSGFSWGYGGEGPHGLYTFLQMLGAKLFTQEQIAKWPQERFPGLTITEGEDY